MSIINNLLKTNQPEKSNNNLDKYMCKIQIMRCTILFFQLLQNEHNVIKYIIILKKRIHPTLIWSTLIYLIEICKQTQIYRD